MDQDIERKLAQIIANNEVIIWRFRNYQSVLSELEKRGLVRCNTDGTYGVIA